MRAPMALLFAFLTFFSCAQTALAACYAPEQRRAEELLRFHSELMVIVVTCQTASDGTPLAPLYAAFTRANKESIHRAEDIMRAHYEKTKKGQGLKGVDRLRTQLANKAGQTVADLKAPVFCAKKRDFLTQIGGLSAQDLAQAAQQADTAATPLETSCDARLNSP